LFKDSNKPNKGSEVPLTLSEDLVNFEYDPLNFRQRLSDLPADWSIIQISEIYPGQRLSPPKVETRPLRITRLGCGPDSDQISVQEVAKPHPLPAARNADLLDELKAVIQGHADLISGPKLTNFKHSKLMFEERYMVIIFIILW